METSENRFTYLDNLRNMLVYAVVLFHILCMYAYPLVFFWPVIGGRDSSVAFETIIFTMDIFLMPVLIFIAALFIVPSLKARSAPGYIRKRFQRLVIPMVVFIFCAGDIYHQFLLMRLGFPSPGYAQVFLDYWRDFINGGVINILGKGKMLYQVNFNMLHAWFLSFLFVMTLVVVIFYLPFRKKEKNPKKVDTRRTIIVKTIIFAVLSGILYFVISIGLTLAGVELNSWLQLFGFIQVRISQFWMLLPMFFFGLHVYRKEWLTKGDIGSWKMWGLFSVMLLVPFIVISYARYIPMIENYIRVFEHNILFTEQISFPEITEEFKQLFTLVNFMLLPICVFLLMFFLSFAKKYFNRPNRVTDFCSKHSIHVYILHYIPVIMLQYYFLKLHLPPAVTVAAIMIIVIPACLWLSHRLVYPYPLAAIGLFTALKLVSLYLGFGFYNNALLVILIVSFIGAAVESVRLVMASRKGTWDLNPPSRYLPPEGE